MSIAFDAPAGRGWLRLKLPGLAADAVAAAAALAQQEDRLAALEAWLGLPLDPKPAASGGDTGDLLWLTGDDWRLGLSWPLLAAADQAPALDLRWPAASLDVELAAFDSSPVPAGVCEGVVLLTSGCEPPWPVRLRARDWPLTLVAAWGGPGTSLQHCQTPVWGDAAAAEAPCTVRLREPLVWPLPDLLGWTGQPPPLPGASAVLLVPGEAPRGGRLAPALGGMGLWLAD